MMGGINPRLRRAILRGGLAIVQPRADEAPGLVRDLPAQFAGIGLDRLRASAIARKMARAAAPIGLSASAARRNPR